MSKTLAQGLLEFVKQSPTPYHCVQSLRGRLEKAGYEELVESGSWKLTPGAKRFVVRDGSIAAFQLGSEGWDGGLRIMGAHTDSPCLKVKPTPSRRRHGYCQLGVEIYGGVLLAPWFDRDLSLAGRLCFRDKQGKLALGLVDLERPIATIPSLAIHLDRDVNENRSINKQKELPVVLLQSEKDLDFKEWLAGQCSLVNSGAEILGFELLFYDTHPPAMIGAESQFIASARLDNQLSCYAGLEGLLAAAPTTNAVLVCNDHEEVGSQSHSGADGAFLEQVFCRLLPDLETRLRVLSRSYLISCDNAHGVHPNYPEKHEENHGPLLNGGPVIKVNANQRYATNGETAGLVRFLCEQADVPTQTFVIRSDMVCGSTIGPITASRLGVKTVDIGVPTFGMHSIRELAGTQDVEYLVRFLTKFCSNTSW